MAEKVTKDFKEEKNRNLEQAILQIEKGEKKPSQRLLSLYSKKFGVSERLLIAFTSEIKNKEKKSTLNSKEILLLILKKLCNEKDI